MTKKTDEMLKEMKAALAEHKTEAAKLEAAIAGLEGKVPAAPAPQPAAPALPPWWLWPYIWGHGYGCQCLSCKPVPSPYITITGTSTIPKTCTCGMTMLGGTYCQIHGGVYITCNPDTVAGTPSVLTGTVSTSGFLAVAQTASKDTFELGGSLVQTTSSTYAGLS